MRTKLVPSGAKACLGKTHSFLKALGPFNLSFVVSYSASEGLLNFICLYVGPWKTPCNTSTKAALIEVGTAKFEDMRFGEIC
jgi:hypothetical protein